MNPLTDLLYSLAELLPLILAIILLRMLYYRLKIKLVGRLKYNRVFSSDGVFEGDEAQIIETIENTTFLPLFWVDVEFYLHGSLKLNNHSDVEGMQSVISRFHIPPFTRITRTHDVTCTKRGYYTMNSASVYIKGLRTEKTTYFEVDSSLHVYPKPLEHGLSPHPISLLHGETHSVREAMMDPFSQSGIRDYAFGDPFNMIHFKASAKSAFLGNNYLKVHRYDYVSDRVIMLYLNFEPPEEETDPDAYRSAMEHALSLSASFASEALYGGYRIGFAANCRMENGDLQLIFPLCGGSCHIEDLLRAMSKINIREGVSFRSLLDNGAGSSLSGAEIFILTTHTDETIDESIALLQRFNRVRVITL